MRQRKTIEKYKEIGEYIVYPDGRVFTKRRGKFLTPILGKGKSKYYYIKIPNRVSLARLIAKCFILNPENKPQVNHKNGIKTDNHVNNLEWSTRLENMAHAFSTGLNKGIGRAKLKSVDVLIIREALKTGLDKKGLAKYYNVGMGTINCIQNGDTWRSL